MKIGELNYTPKVKCADCACYKFQRGLTSEPLGDCMIDDQKVMPYLIYNGMYNGKNWRLNQRSSNVLRYCKGFAPKGSNVKVWRDGLCVDEELSLNCSSNDSKKGA